MAWYEPDSFTINDGSVDSGTITDTYTDNGTSHTLNEVTGTPGFDYEYWFETIPGTVNWFRVKVNGYYEGNPAHIVDIQVWNYTTAAWVDVDIMLDDTGDNDYYSPDLSEVDYVSGGQAKVRFYHAASGNTSHYLYLDQVVLEDRSSLYSTAAPTTSPPTTVAPSTQVPTTLLSTPVPTTTLTTVVPTTAVPGVDITAGPIDIVVSIAQVALHYYPPAAVNPAYDGYLRSDPIDIVVSVSGYSGTVGIIAGSIDIVVSQHGAAPVLGQVIDQGPIEIVIGVVTGFEGLIVEIEKCNFVKWSKIGRLDFDIDESNLAGERPVDWKGCIWHLKKLGDKMIAYGDNGVTLLKPSGVHYGMETVYRIGLKNKGAMVGDDSTHFFVDKLGQLYQIDSKITKLDYSEFISQMGTVILTLDYEKQILYICDGTYGYVYGVRDKSFGEGPVNVTGFGVQTGNLYVVSAGEIVTPKFEICTDIYDLGTRKAKTIRSIEIGTDITQFLYASVDYKIDYTEGFKQIGWFLVNPNGVAHPRCYGHEFRFRLMSTVYEYFEIDWIKIKGMIHGFSWLDQFGNPSDD